MKVFACPEELEWEEPDYGSGFDFAKEQKREEEHLAKLREWLKPICKGKYTGEIYREPMGDGYACYLMADSGKAPGSFLIHLPYGDAWDSRNVQFIPRDEIIKRIEQQKGLDAIFAKKENTPS